MIPISTNLQEIATKVMDQALPVEPGEAVSFLAGGHNLDLAYAFAAECSARDIEALVVTEPDFVADARLRKAPLEYFERAPKLLPSLVERSEWIIFMTGSRHDRAIFNDSALRNRLIEIERRSVWSFYRLVQLCLSTETHLLAFLDPDIHQAEALGLSFDDVKERFLESLDIDYEALTAQGERLIAKLRGVREIHLTSPGGTNLYVRSGDRPWVNDDGGLARPDGVAPYIHNLPVGEVFVAPLEDSAEGVLLPETRPGSPVRGVRIEFDGSKPAQISADEGFEYLLANLDKATGNPYCIAEFAMGTNPCADPLLATEKAYGTAHVAIGQNTWLGGTNECSIHWDYLVDNPTITVDGDYLLKDGEFTA